MSPAESLLVQGTLEMLVLKSLSLAPTAFLASWIPARRAARLRRLDAIVSE
jgi:ABC-type lipoprotein release transport system permease subunit